MSYPIALIVRALIDEELLREGDAKTAEIILAVSLRDYLVRYWHIDDVFELAPYLSDDEARQVLAHVDETHDANVGINWGVLDIAVQSLSLESLA